MANDFIGYLCRERIRIAAELDRATSSGAPRAEVARLEALRRLVGDQIGRWSRDLADDRIAA